MGFILNGFDFIMWGLLTKEFHSFYLKTSLIKAWILIDSKLEDLFWNTLLFLVRKTDFQSFWPEFNYYGIWNSC